MAAKAEASGSGGGAGSVDSDQGWLISLTSMVEIRYEGILFHIDESVIVLRNVISFGTEGRKKDGPQISPSDKVYGYVSFNGSCIKDLQVKSAPPVQPTPPPIYNNPAIIQSHYSQRASSSTSIPSVGSVTIAAHSSHAVQPGLSTKHLTVPGLTLPYQPASQSVSVFGRPSTSSQAETSVPSLVTPHQLIQPGPTTVSSVQPLQRGKDVEAVRPPLPVASASAPAAREVQAPLLPMPTLSDQKLIGTGLLTDQSNGVHERGRGNEDVEENLDCCYWIYTGACPYLFCKFRHKRWEWQEWHRVRASPHKLEPQVDCRVASTWDCCSFVETGSCKYGSQCQFAHREREREPYLLASSPGKIDTNASAKCKKRFQAFEEICPSDP